MDNKFGKTIHHGDPVAGTPASRSESACEIDTHIEKHLGKPTLVLHELASRHVHVDVHIVPPGPDRDFHTLITSGMSDQPMNAPPGAEQLKYAELMLCLPSSWRMKEYEVLTDETWRKDWPVLWLKRLAKFPHVFRTWFFWGHSLPNGDPPTPLAPDTRLCGWVLLEPSLVKEEFKVMTRSDGSKTWFVAAVPVYKEEMDVKLTQGTEKLQELFSAAGVNELINPTRVNVARKN